MPDLTPHSLSHLLTDLIGRKVTSVRIISGSETKLRQAYGVYTDSRNEKTFVVKADLLLLGSLVGALVGLPDSEVRSRLSGTLIEELFRDAIFEVLNVASSVIDPGGQAILVKMSMDTSDLADAAKQIVVKPNHKIDFDVSVEGYQGGRLTVLS
jgi:hypothetical protein